MFIDLLMFYAEGPSTNSDLYTWDGFTLGNAFMADQNDALSLPRHIVQLGDSFYFPPRPRTNDSGLHRHDG